MVPSVFEQQYDKFMSGMTNEYNHKLLKKDNSNEELNKKLMSTDTISKI